MNPTPPLAPTVFVSMCRSALGAQHVRFLAHSLRTFGGPLSGAPLWVFLPHSASAPLDPEIDPGRFSGLDPVHFIPFSLEPDVPDYLFSEKVHACARAEALADAQARTLVWLDPSCLITNPPVLFDLAPDHAAAFRPVHHKNVGLTAQEPLDAFWQAIYQAVGLRQAPFSLPSFVDRQELRPYFNTHCFAVDPAQGLLRAWQSHFERLAADQDFQARACSDTLHQVFLHQAILSALVASRLERGQLRILPPEYSYPLHMHPQVPPLDQPATLDELVCPVYEDAFVYPDTLNGLAAQQPLRAWLEQHAPEVQPGA
ncbi:MAG: hypothetical protein AB1894_11135 [Chloroflexota bacterium]